MMWPVLWCLAEHEAVTERPWDEVSARSEIGAIVADAERAKRDGFWPGHPLDDVGERERLCSLYLGSAGMIWALHRLGSRAECANAIENLIECYRSRPDFGSAGHAPSLLLGETGLQVLALKLGAPSADRDRLRELVRKNREHPTWELMWGSPGTVLAARTCDLEDEWEQSAALLSAKWDRASDLWTQAMYGNARQYLGPVHGFAGNVHALRGYLSEDTLRSRVTRVVRRTAQHRDGLVNWPPSLGESADKIRVQWCHGAPGIVSTIGDLIPQQLAIAAGELTWRAGPLRKGPSLCHGTAGNGFSFLRLHDLTGDRLWLERARRFAMHAIEQVRRQRAEFGRGRYTLWTGDIGVALYLHACAEADPAFPTIDTF